jgi:hypothetical protein
MAAGGGPQHGNHLEVGIVELNASEVPQATTGKARTEAIAPNSPPAAAWGDNHRPATQSCTLSPPRDADRLAHSTRSIRITAFSVAISDQSRLAQHRSAEPDAIVSGDTRTCALRRKGLIGLTTRWRPRTSQAPCAAAPAPLRQTSLPTHTPGPDRPGMDLRKKAARSEMGEPPGK